MKEGGAGRAHAQSKGNARSLPSTAAMGSSSTRRAGRGRFGGLGNWPQLSFHPSRRPVHKVMLDTGAGRGRNGQRTSAAAPALPQGSIRDGAGVVIHFDNREAGSAAKRRRRLDGHHSWHCARPTHSKRRSAPNTRGSQLWGAEAVGAGRHLSSAGRQPMVWNGLGWGRSARRLSISPAGHAKGNGRPAAVNWVGPNRKGPRSAVAVQGMDGPRPGARGHHARPSAGPGNATTGSTSAAFGSKEAPRRSE